MGSRHLGADASPEVPLGSSSGDSVGEWRYVTFFGFITAPEEVALSIVISTVWQAFLVELERVDGVREWWQT